MRSAASLSATLLRAAETSGVMAPPSTTIPSGGPRVSSQGGKRCSSGMISALPSGESPITASAIRLATIKSLPMRAPRVAKSRTPRSPSMIARLEGIAKKPRTLDRMKNIDGTQLADQPCFFHAS